MNKFKHAALGGTFDHFHSGHEYILNFALKNAEKLSIGIATSDLHKDKEFSETIEHYSYRKNAVETFFNSNHALDRVNLFKLHDIYGTTITDKTLDSIVVTEETELNAHRINDERRKKGLKPLEIVKCPFITGPDKNVISSTNIRAGSINREGFPYSALFISETLYLPNNLREDLREAITEPLFHIDEMNTAKKVIAEIKKCNPILTIGVGDIVNETLVNAGYSPSLQIVDYKTRRQEIGTKSVNESAERYKNEPGTIYKSAVIQIHYKIQEVLHDNMNRTMVIDGEEDLLALPAILLAPLHSIVLYGQFDQGIVLVTITEEIKEKVANLVTKFTHLPK